MVHAWEVDSIEPLRPGGWILAVLSKVVYMNPPWWLSHWVFVLLSTRSDIRLLDEKAVFFLMGDRKIKRHLCVSRFDKLKRFTSSINWWRCHNRNWRHLKRKVQLRPAPETPHFRCCTETTALQGCGKLDISVIGLIFAHLQKNVKIKTVSPTFASRGTSTALELHVLRLKFFAPKGVDHGVELPRTNTLLNHVHLRQYYSAEQG